MFRRTADPVVLARTSGLVKAWERRVREKAAGDPLFDEHWYVYLMSIARPVPRPFCDACEDTGLVRRDCTIHDRCRSWICAPSARRGDPDWTHSYVRACSCSIGQQLRPGFEAVAERHHATTPAAKGYGFTKAGGR